MLLFGMALMLLAILLFGVAVILPKAHEVPVDRRRPYEVGTGSQLTRFTGSATDQLHGILTRRNIRMFNREELENAGLRMRQAEFFILVIAGAFVGALIGLIVGGPWLAVLFFLAAPLVGKLVVRFLAGKRRTKFDDQLGDTLQLLAGSLRAGHSILRAIDAAAAESAVPTSEEMRRVITETSLGRDLQNSLNDTAERMRSEDFVWIAQAIQINREVGGNLAEVLDQVNETIRERSEIKGHIKSLAAEGKFSGYILMALPFGIVTMLMVVNPGYMEPMFTHPLGWGMIAASAILMTIGGLWMRKIIDLKF
ncbi:MULTISPECIES: type II secretion system F family protein [Arthrobacter]|uniref:Type II secretion system protein F n=1 Tax=Arthrobacter terricola TaxID=2547396 RepID=A0A4R5KKC8_9MICC|nr:MULTISPECIES: type II secretion system F family protein [Arthrobacter]MBT8159203.1 type II secretion system F family protein [Arthrobacter sp. GN70]TDF94957.1 type II secretion system protein F [Arthrobacter terricola]